MHPLQRNLRHFLDKKWALGRNTSWLLSNSFHENVSRQYQPCKWKSSLIIGWIKKKTTKKLYTLLLRIWNQIRTQWTWTKVDILSIEYFSGKKSMFLWSKLFNKISYMLIDQSNDCFSRRSFTDSSSWNLLLL